MSLFMQFLSVVLAEDDITGLTLKGFLSYVGGLGGTSVIIIFSYLWIKGLIVTKAQLDETRRDRDEWKSMAFRATGSAERLQGTTDRVAGMVGRAVETTNLGNSNNPTHRDHP